jgi:hypothetical protein
MNKDTLIKDFLNTEISVGDKVYVRGLGLQDKTKMGASTLVEEVLVDGNIVIYEHGTKRIVSSSDYIRCTLHLGPNPFKKEIRHESFQIDIEQLLYRVGYNIYDNKFSDDRYFDGLSGECNFNPTVVVDGLEVEYQRGLVWTLRQKQLLIESIYNRVDIGKIVLRRRSFTYVEGRIKSTGKKTYFNDLVDGKQRVTTLIEFCTNKFKDMHGNYYRDLSGIAQNKFRGYRNIQFVQLPEDITDSEVLEVFLGINHTGKPMSEKHIKFVKSLLK